MAMAAIALLVSVPVEAGASGLTRAPAYEARVSTLPPAVRELMSNANGHWSLGGETTMHGPISPGDPGAVIWAET